MTTAKKTNTPGTKAAPAKAPAKPAPPKKAPPPWATEFTEKKVLNKDNFGELLPNFSKKIDERLERNEKIVWENLEIYKELDELALRTKDEIASILISHAKEYNNNNRQVMKDANDWEAKCLENAYAAKIASNSAFRDWRVRFALLISSPKYAAAILKNPDITKLISWNTDETVIVKPSLSKKLVPKKDIITQDYLGRGAFGIVHKGIIYGNVIAIKVLQKNPKPESGGSITQSFASVRVEFEKECQLLAGLDHKFVLRFMGACFEEKEGEDPYCALLTELAENGSLNDILYKKQTNPTKLSFNRKMQIVGEIVEGMHYLHHCLESQVLHLDIKPANILMDADYHVRIADFGMSKIMGREFFSSSPMGSFVGGTPFYMSPEVFPQKIVTKVIPPSIKSDVYSFGILVNELVEEVEPYSNVAALQKDKKTFENLMKAVLGGEVPGTNRPQVGVENLPLKNFIESCWKSDPDQRPTFKDLLRDQPWKAANASYAAGGEQKAEKVSKIFQTALVPFTEWVKKIDKNFNAQNLQSNEDPHYRALVALTRVGNAGSADISKDTSDRFLNWVKDIKKNDNEICKVMYTVCCQDWFWGEASENAAVNVLSSGDNKTEKTFLVRWWDRHWYISYVEKEKAKEKKGNFVIKHEELSDKVQTFKEMLAEVEDKKKVLKLLKAPESLRPPDLQGVKVKRQYVTSVASYATATDVSLGGKMTTTSSHYNYIV